MSVRRNWASHGFNGWYIDAAPEHYCCYRVYITSTATKCITKTVESLPHNFAMPETSSAEDNQSAARDLIYALANLSPAAPFATLGQDQLRAIRQLNKIFYSSANPLYPLDVPLI